MAQITTIRRYGGNSARTKIPIGSFYGHTFILPWEYDRGGVTSSPSSATSPSLPGPLPPRAPPDSGGGEQGSGGAGAAAQIMAQLGVYASLLEEVGIHVAMRP